MAVQVRDKYVNSITRNLRSYFTATTLLVLSACNAINYSPPEKAERSLMEFEAVVPYSFDATWRKVLSHVLRERYFIETYDKASETITVSFGRSNPSHFADCGLVSASPLLAYPDWRREFNAVMYIRLTRMSPSETEVTAQATYDLYGRVLLIIDSQRIRDKRARWIFETGSFDEQMFYEDFGEVTCKPTHAAERGVIEAVLAE